MSGDPAGGAEEDESLQLEDQDGITRFIEISGVHIGPFHVAPVLSGSQGVLHDIDPAVSDDEQGDGRHQAGGDAGKEPERGDRRGRFPTSVHSPDVSSVGGKPTTIPR